MKPTLLIEGAVPSRTFNNDLMVRKKSLSIVLWFRTTM